MINLTIHLALPHIDKSIPVGYDLSKIPMSKRYNLFADHESDYLPVIFHILKMNREADLYVTLATPPLQLFTGNHLLQKIMVDEAGILALSSPPDPRCVKGFRLEDVCNRVAFQRAAILPHFFNEDEQLPKHTGLNETQLKQHLLCLLDDKDPPVPQPTKTLTLRVGDSVQEMSTPTYLNQWLNEKLTHTLQQRNDRIYSLKRQRVQNELEANWARDVAIRHIAAGEEADIVAKQLHVSLETAKALLQRPISILNVKRLDDFDEQCEALESELEHTIHSTATDLLRRALLTT